jgi:uncharacterized protein YndB with AHSA1/START domain
MTRPTIDLTTLLPVAADRDADGQHWTLILTRDLRHAPETVWTALTEPAQLACWAPFEADRDLGATGPATLRMIDGDSATDLPSTVTRVEAPRLLEYRWGTDLLRWELERQDGGTRLTLRQTVADPDWLPKAAAGWHLCLEVAGHLLDGHPIPPIRGRDALDHGWPELNQAYSSALGLPATPLPPRVV